MSAAHILTEDFAQAAATAGLRARQNALNAGHPVVFLDASGRYVEELPNGTKLEVRLHAGTPRESHLEVLGELAAPLK